MESNQLAESYLRLSRAFKIKLAEELRKRRDDLGLRTDPESPLWLSQFERYAIPEHWTHQWKYQLTVFESPFWNANSPFNRLVINGLANTSTRNVRIVEAEPIPTF